MEAASYIARNLRARPVSAFSRLLGFGLFCSLVCIATFAQQATTGPTLLIPSAHRAGIASGVKVLATNSESTWFATLGGDETICIWNASDAHFLAKVSAKGVLALAILPKSHLVMTGDSDSNVRLVDVDSFTTIKSAKLDGSVEWLQSTADGRVFAFTLSSLYRLDPSTLAATRLSGFDPSLTPQSAAINEDGRLIGMILRTTGSKPDRVLVYAASDGAIQVQKDLPRMRSIAISGDLVAMGSADSDDTRSISGHVLVIHVPDGTVVSDIAVKRVSSSLLLTKDDSHASQPAGLISSFAGGMERFSLVTGKSLQESEKNEVFSQLAMQGRELIAAGTGGAPNLCDEVTLRCTAPNVVQGVSATQARILGDGSLLLIDTNGHALRIKETVRFTKLYPAPTLALIPKFKGSQDTFALGRTDDIGGMWVNNVLVPVDPPDLISNNTFTLAASADGHYVAARAAFVRGKELTVSLYDLSKLGNEAMASPPLLSSWNLTSEEQPIVDAASEFQFGFTPD